jgi:Icc protein
VSPPRLRDYLAGAALALLISSCGYTIDLSFFWRDDAVGDRVAQTLGGTIDLGLPASYSFLVVGDPHFGSASAAGPEVLARFSALVASRDDAFVVFAGDQVDAGLSEQYTDFCAWANSLRKSSTMALPWYALVGNHDLYNDGWTNYLSYIYDTGHGRSYSVLDAGGFSLYLLDTGNATLGRAQYERLLADMGADPKPKIALSHYALRGSEYLYYYRLTNSRERALLFELFAENGVKLAIEGHWHYLIHSSYAGYFDEWLVESLTYEDDAGLRYCFAVNISGSESSMERLHY